MQTFRPGDPGYDTERTGFNLALDHRPALIVAATGPADVEAAVRLAANDGLPVAVQATGHGVSVPADGAVLISTRRMDGVEIDPEARTAQVEAGVPSHALIDAAARHGLAPLNGTHPNVGVVGYTLGGGVPLLGRQYGYAADRVRWLDVVGADGRTRRVDAEIHPDLFWALRGGKGNFGVVVAMELDLFPIARLYGGGLYFSPEAAADVLHAYVDWTRTAPEELASSILLARLPPGYVAHLRLTYPGPAEEAERIIAPLRELGPKVDDTVRDMPYTDVASIHHEPTEPMAAYDRNLLLGELDTQAADAILAQAGPEANASYVLELRHLGGAFARPPEVPSAVGGRDAAFSLFTASLFTPDELDDVRREHDALHAALAPWSTGGALLNFMGIDQVTPDRVRTAFAPADFARLQDLKATYDPDDLFRINHRLR